MSGEMPNARWRHDLKNQLGIILGFSELLLDDMGPEHPLRSDLEEIQRAGQKAMQLVDEIDGGRPAAGSGAAPAGDAPQDPY